MYEVKEKQITPNSKKKETLSSLKKNNYIFSSFITKQTKKRTLNKTT